MAKKDKKNTVVVIGDWFFDENWLVARNFTYSSSHTGNFHYLSMHKGIDKRMFNLCGAAELLEVLRSYCAKNSHLSESFDFIGYGSWNRVDNNIIQCMLCPKHKEHKFITPYTILTLKHPVVDENKTAIRKCPYDDRQDCEYKPNLINLSTDNNASTNKIIRCYEGTAGGEPHLLHRIDWQLPSSASLNLKLFDDLKKRNVIAVVIEDHGKGVLNPDLVEALFKSLKSNLKNIRFYIRTKLIKPEWMEVFNDKKIEARLITIDYKLYDHIKGQRRASFGKELCCASLELLGELTGTHKYQHGKIIKDDFIIKSQRAAVMFDDNTAISKDGERCYNIYKPVGEKELINIGRTTMFFNALIAQDLLLNENKDVDFGMQCYKALICGYEWSKKSTKAWKEEKLNLYGDYDDALDLLEKKMNSIEIMQNSCHVNDYENNWVRWIESSKDFGIVKTDNDKFEFWRGEGALKKYICVGGPKRDNINNMIRSIHQYVNKTEPKHSLHCLLVASPGWGKSFLAQCIAKHFDMHYAEFSIAELATTKDLTKCFDYILSMQNRQKKKLLIFIDEINCKIENDSATRLLLGPIWNGSFVRDGLAYRLQPSVWMFASTESIESLIGNTKKGSDFLARLNGPIIQLDTYKSKKGVDTLLETIKTLKKKIIEDPSEDIYDEVEYLAFAGAKGPFKTEQVYLGVSLLNNLWGPINKIQMKVLKLFHNLLPVNGFRSMEFFVSKFNQIERGVVLCSNVPSIDDYKELKHHIVFPKDWAPEILTKKDELLIEVETLLQ